MEKEPRCPHCNEIYDINDNESYHLYSTDDIEELQCSNCEKEFFVKVITSYRFESEKDLDDFI